MLITDKAVHFEINVVNITASVPAIGNANGICYFLFYFLVLHSIPTCFIHIVLDLWYLLFRI